MEAKLESQPEKASATRPVRDLPGELPQDPADGIGLCLSGGGYRAMLFHVGALWRLQETGVLARTARISSVSGGSITAGVLGLAWEELQRSPADFQRLVADPVRQLASRTIDFWAIIKGALLGTVSNRIASAYDRHLFDGAKLDRLPDTPSFVFNATNVQSGALWRFSKAYMRDWRVGEVKGTKRMERLAFAVAASSAFPPVLSPARLTFDGEDFTPKSGKDLQVAPYTTRVVLADGGVYDNLGLETVWKRYRTVLVSDAGGQMAPDPRPWRNWVLQVPRVLMVVDNQVRSLRKRQLIGSYLRPDGDRDHRKGAYWGIRSDITHYELNDSLPCPPAWTDRLARTPTRLKALPARLQEELINWGYAICDAGLRAHVDPSINPPVGFPYRQATSGLSGLP